MQVVLKKNELLRANLAQFSISCLPLSLLYVFIRLVEFRVSGIFMQKAGIVRERRFQTFCQILYIILNYTQLCKTKGTKYVKDQYKAKQIVENSMFEMKYINVCCVKRIRLHV